MTLAPGSALARDWLVIGAMAILLFFWVIPVTALAGLLSYREIKKTWPALARLIDADAQIGAIVQNLLPSVAVISLNACLPFLLEGRSMNVSVQLKRAEYGWRRLDVHSRLQGTQLDRVLSTQEVLPIPTHQRRLHIPIREYVLATYSGPRELARQDP